MEAKILEQISKCQKKHPTLLHRIVHKINRFYSFQNSLWSNQKAVCVQRINRVPFSNYEILKELTPIPQTLTNKNKIFNNQRYLSETAQENNIMILDDRWVHLESRRIFKSHRSLIYSRRYQTKMVIQHQASWFVKKQLTPLTLNT